MIYLGYPIIKYRVVLMQSIQVGNFKANLSAIIERVEKNGEMFILEYGRKHKKVAVIAPYKKSMVAAEKRCFGQLEGKIVIPDNFNDESEEINQMFYGHAK